MFEELAVKNFALIDNLNVRFEPGFNVFTGETGAGKSIILDALSLLLGSRADSSAVRGGEKSCEISGLFDISSKRFKLLREKLDELGISFDGREPLIIRRIVDVEGRSRCYINAQSVNVSTLDMIGEYLVDIHGQNDHQAVFKTACQLEMLDSFADNKNLHEKYLRCYESLSEVDAKIKELSISEQEKNQKIDLYTYQLSEIEQSELKIGEDEEIASILPQVKNKDRLCDLLNNAYEMLYASEGSASERLQSARKHVEQAVPLGGDLKTAEENLIKIQYLLEEAVDSVRSSKEKLSSDDYDIDRLIAKQELIGRLKKKYGSDIRKIIEHARRLKEELLVLQQRDDLLADLNAERQSLLKNLQASAKKLTVSRKTAGDILARNIEKELKDLGMAKSKFIVSVEPLSGSRDEDSYSASGSDRVEFFVSLNPGEEPKPLKDTASGGESSRIMLCLKKILSESDNIFTLVYDEIDAGIGGSTGHSVGEKLSLLAETHQVICVSHLPQIASRADAHYFVGKETLGGRTKTFVKQLQGDGRLKEIARMLDGDSASSLSIKHAEEMLANAAR